MNAPREQQLSATQAARADAEKPLLAELDEAGIHVSSYAFLDWKAQPYPQALDILIHHVLHNPDLDDMSRGFLAQKLGVPPMRARWDELVHMYREASEPQTRVGLAATLASIATRQHYEQLRGFIHDPSLGEVRIAFIRPYVRLGEDAARDDIRPLADDPVLGKEVTAVLKGRSPNQ